MRYTGTPNHDFFVALLWVPMVAFATWSSAYIKRLSSQSLTFQEFNAVLITEIRHEYVDAAAMLTESGVWHDANNGEWRYSLLSGKEKDMNPFIICTFGTDHSGFERIKGLEKKVQRLDWESWNITSPGSVQFLFNSNEKTCILTRLPPYLAAKIALSADKEHDKVGTMRVQPLLPFSKMINHAVQNIVDHSFGQEESQNFSSKVGAREESQRFARDVHENGRTEYLSDTELPRMTVLLCPGVIVESSKANADTVVHAIKSFLLAKSESGKLSKANEQFFDRYAFGLETSNEWVSHVLRNDFWRKVFRQGIDSNDVHCHAMIEQLDFRVDLSTSFMSIDEPKEKSGTLGHSHGTKWCFLSILASLSVHNDVCFVEALPPARVFNAQAQWLVQSGIKAARPWFDVGLTGRGQVVAASDTGIDTDNCYFYDAVSDFKTDGDYYPSSRKVVQYIPFGNSDDVARGHGTHVCGTICGHRAVDGVVESTGLADGIARDAKIAFMDISKDPAGERVVTPVSDVVRTGRDPDSKGKVGHAKLHSSSWGTNQNTYSAAAAIIDDYCNRNDDFLHIIASGNTGDGNTFGSIGEPATAKNIIAVGAGHSSGSDLMSGQLGEAYIASFSSRGPTVDGRTKPDVIAPGKFILSAGALPSQHGECDPPVVPDAGEASEGVLSLEGTSMAAPVVAGTAALVRQYFEEGWFNGTIGSGKGHDPSGALVKAVLLNGAQSMAGVDNGNCQIAATAPYDPIQNFGRVSLADSLYIKGLSNIQAITYDRQDIFDGQTKDVTVIFDQTNGCRSSVLSATLVWTDPPTIPGCASCLINDLDLSVVKIGGNLNTSAKWYPNGLTEPDRVNNVERVRVDASNGDTFVVSVQAKNLITRHQQYAIVITGCFGGTQNALNTSESVYRHGPVDCQSDTSRIIVSVAVIAALVLFIIAFMCCICKCIMSRRRRRQDRYDDYRLVEPNSTTGEGQEIHEGTYT